MELYNGDIFRVMLKDGREREAVILSTHDNYSTILMLGDDDRQPYAINCNGTKYTNPGMVSYIFNDTIMDFVRSMTNSEYNDLMKSVIDYLGYDMPVKEVVKEIKPEPVVSDVQNIELTKAQAERDVYKNLYENLIKSMISR